MSPLLDMEKSTLGGLTSLFMLSCGASKFASSVLSDFVSARTLLTLGLAICGAVNIAMAVSGGERGDTVAFRTLWAAHGFFQGWGWPPCAMLIRAWFTQVQRATAWSLVSIGQNIGTALAPSLISLSITHGARLVLALSLVAPLPLDWIGMSSGEGDSHNAWRLGFLVPGASAIFIAAAAFLTIKDRPTTTTCHGREDGLREPVRKTRTSDQRASVVRDVLLNPTVAALCLCNLLAYVVKTAMSSWALLYAVEAKGFGGTEAGNIWSAYQLGGLCGTLVAGRLSDRWFGGRRGPVCCIYSVGILAALAAMWVVDGGVALSVAVGALGFATFGPQSLLGLFCVEVAPAGAVGLASGVMNLAAQAGAAIAGYPLGVAVQSWGWIALFLYCGVSAGAMVATLAPMWYRHVDKQKPE